MCYIGYTTIKDSKCVKFNSVNLLYFIINKVNGYFEEINGNNPGGTRHPEDVP